MLPPSKFEPQLHPRGAGGKFRRTFHLPDVPHPRNVGDGPPSAPERAVKGAGRAVADRKEPVPLPIPAPPQKDWIDVGSDVNKAADLLAEGKYVKLDQPREASTLLAELAKRVQEAKAKGKDAPNFDLCKVTVRNTNLFCAESQGIPRIKMPQLSGKPMPGTPAAKLPVDSNGEVDIGPAFRKHLEAMGHKVTVRKEKASRLRASQIELNGGKVGGMVKVLDAGRKLGEGKPIFISRDNYVVDGHHRWAAEVGHDLEDGHLGDVSMDVERVDMPIIELLAEANDFGAKMGLPRVGVGDAFPPLPKDLDQPSPRTKVREDWADFDAKRHAHLLSSGRRIKVKILGKKFEGKILRRGGMGSFLAEVGGVRQRLRPREIASIMESSSPLFEADLSPGSAMVALYPDPDVANALAVPGGEDPEDHHVTLAYLGDGPWTRGQLDGVRDAVLGAARGQGPIEGSVSGTGMFTEGPEPVAYYSVDAPDLPEFRQAVVRNLEARGLPVSRDHGFSPHITAAYGEPDEGWDESCSGMPLSFPAVSIVVGGNRYDVPLHVEAPVDARVPEPAVGVAEREHLRLKCPKCGMVQPASNASCRECGHDLGEARKAKMAKLSESRWSMVSHFEAPSLHSRFDTEFDEAKHPRLRGKFARKAGLLVSDLPKSHGDYGGIPGERQVPASMVPERTGRYFHLYGHEHADPNYEKDRRRRFSPYGAVSDGDSRAEIHPGFSLASGLKRPSEEKVAAAHERLVQARKTGKKLQPPVIYYETHERHGSGSPKTLSDEDAALVHAMRDAGWSRIPAVTTYYKKDAESIARVRDERDREERGGLRERDFSAGERRKAVSAGEALPDGSFPIRNEGDLGNAVRALGRAAPGKRAAVRAHIKRRAKALGVENPLQD